MESHIPGPAGTAASQVLARSGLVTIHLSLICKQACMPFSDPGSLQANFNSCKQWQKAVCSWNCIMIHMIQSHAVHSKQATKSTANNWLVLTLHVAALLCTGPSQFQELQYVAEPSAACKHLCFIQLCAQASSPHRIEYWHPSQPTHGCVHAAGRGQGCWEGRGCPSPSSLRLQA